jgi:hypothetical protein
MNTYTIRFQVGVPTITWNTFDADVPALSEEEARLKIEANADAYDPRFVSREGDTLTDDDEIISITTVTTP